MWIFSEIQIPALVSTAVYSGMGLICFIVCWRLVKIMMPFDVVKEIEEDQNTSLGLIIGSMMLGLCLIISAAIISPSDTGTNLKVKATPKTPAATTPK